MRAVAYHREETEEARLVLPRGQSDEVAHELLAAARSYLGVRCLPSASGRGLPVCDGARATKSTFLRPAVYQLAHFLSSRWWNAKGFFACVQIRKLYRRVDE